MMGWRAPDGRDGIRERFMFAAGAPARWSSLSKSEDAVLSRSLRMRYHERPDNDTA